MAGQTQPNGAEQLSNTIFQLTNVNEKFHYSLRFYYIACDYIVSMFMVCFVVGMSCRFYWYTNNEIRSRRSADILHCSYCGYT